MIRETSPGTFKIFSKKGKVLGVFGSYGAAATRLKQIEFFKHLKS